MRYVVSCLVAFVWLAVLSPGVGCHRSAETPKPPKKAGPPTIGVSLADIQGPLQTQLKADIEAAAAKHPNLRLVIRDAGGDAAMQKRNLDDFLAERVNLVIVAPIDAQALTEPVAKLFDAGVPVILLGQAVIGDKYTCYIAPDWKLIGETAGKWLAGKLDGKGKIVEIKGPVDSTPADELHDAFRARLRDPGYRFVFDGFLDPPRVDGAKLMAAAIADVDQFDAVFAFDDAAARAAHETAKAAGREKGTLFVGVGGLPDQGAKYVKEGVLSASILVPTGGVEAIRAAAKILGGGKVPKKIVPPTHVLAE